MTTATEVSGMTATHEGSPSDRPGPATGESPAAESTRYLTFTLNGETYALDIFHVTEILEHRPLTVVPMMPAFVRGVINLRGRAVPVVDLAIRFERGTTAIARRTSVVIVHISALGPSDASGQDIGILVDAVNKVVDFTPDEIEPAPSFAAGSEARYLAGMAKRDDGFVLILDIDRILSLEDLAGLGAASAAAPATEADPRDRSVPAGP